MRFNFRRIASGAASMAMLGSTIALAAAASFPDGYVQDGVADVGVFYGSNLDLSAVTDITSSLSQALADQGGSTSTSVPTEGDFILLEKGTNKFNLAEEMDDFYSTIDEDNLEEVLAKGEYLTDDNEDYDFEQELVLGPNALTHFQDSDFNDDKPIIGFDMTSGASIINYTLDFTPDNVECDSSTSGPDYLNCETTELPLMGKTYFVSDVSTTSNGWRIKLLDSAVEGFVEEGETVTVSVDGVAYDVSIAFIDSDEVRLNINGELTNKLSEGQTQKVAGGAAHVGVREVSKLEVSGELGNAEFSIGKGELTLEHGQELELNDDTVSDLTDQHKVNAYITNSSVTELDSITIEWLLDDDGWIAPGTDLVYPVLETFTLSMAGMVFPAEEVTKLDSRGDDSIKLTTEVKDGPVTFDLLYTDNSTNFGEWDGLGEKTTHRLVTSNATAGTGATISVSLSEALNSYFVATWISGDDAESYVYEIQTISHESGKNKTTLDNRVSGGSDVVFDEVGDSKDISEIDLTLSAASDATGNITVTVGPSSSGTVYIDRLVTAEGLQILLPVDSPRADTGLTSQLINLSASPSTHIVEFGEEDDDDNVASGNFFNVTLGFDADDGAEVTAVSVTDIETDDGTDKYIGYVSGALATETLFNNPSNSLGDIEVTYHGAESYAEIYLSGANAVITGSGGELGNVAFMDDELASSGMQGKNLIVVGGTCVNSVAADLLGVSAGTCGSDWEAATGVGAGEWLVQVFSNPNAPDKVATLVGGYEQGDTVNAATAFRTLETIDVAVGNKYTGTTADAATPVVE